MSRRFSLAVLVLCLGVSLPAKADGPRYGAVAPIEHDGIYFRGHFGGGGARTTANVSGQQVVISGSGIDFGAALGRSLSNHWAAFFEAESFRASDANLSVESSPGEGNGETRLSLWGAGPGLVYFLRELNAYIAGSAWLTHTAVTFVDNVDRGTHLGAGLSLKIGKEWVTQHVGMGVVFGMNVSSARDAGQNPSDITWKSGVIHLSFSMSYN